MLHSSFKDKMAIVSINLLEKANVILKITNLPKLLPHSTGSAVINFNHIFI